MCASGARTPPEVASCAISTVVWRTMLSIRLLTLMGAYAEQVATRRESRGVTAVPSHCVPSCAAQGRRGGSRDLTALAVESSFSTSVAQQLVEHRRRAK